MSDIDITDLVKELCLRMDVEYENCTAIVITKDRVEISGHLKNKHGSAYVDPATGEFALELKRFVRT